MADRCLVSGCGRASVSALSVRFSAIWPKSVGTEVPPTRAEAWPAVSWEGLSAPTLSFQAAAIPPDRPLSATPAASPSRCPDRPSAPRR
ncbi:DUF6053 domain-containing protein [Lysobacter enzymogenes]|uniref:DUF6053 domain-containing protein n=1 Tax=Lysobacter enzymogenes TaxID=69 RepID=UPI003D18BAF7